MCEHKSIQTATHSIECPVNEDGSIVVDVWCADCGRCGSITIQPADVQWGDEDDFEGEDPDAVARFAQFERLPKT